MQLKIGKEDSNYHGIQIYLALRSELMDTAVIRVFKANQGVCA
jgi:hypothetical protein